MTREWLPIETAPAAHADEEPQRILVWVADGGKDGRGDVAFGCVYVGRQTGSRRPQANGYGGSAGWKITHWMPLPPPPHDGPG